MNKLVLFYSPFCYFCQKVLMVLRGRDASIELKDTCDFNNRDQLQKGGGKTQVPCLRIEELSEKGEAVVDWLYESDAIIAYLKRHDIAG